MQLDRSRCRGLGAATVTRHCTVCSCVLQFAVQALLKRRFPGSWDEIVRFNFGYRGNSDFTMGHETPMVLQQHGFGSRALFGRKADFFEENDVPVATASVPRDWIHDLLFLKEAATLI